MDSLISVIIPIYKVEKYIDRCIESIVNQTYKNLEIILVDDGSPDNSSKICDVWAKKDSRIKVIHKNNEGVSLARKIGFECSKGEYIMFVDSDDWISLNAVELLYQRIINDNSDMAISNYISVYEDGNSNESPYEWIEDTVESGKRVLADLGHKKTIPYMAWGKLYNREILKEANFVSLVCAEDVIFTISLLRHCNTISFLKNNTYMYFQHSESVMHNRTDNVIFDEVRAYLHIVKDFYSCDELEQAIFYYKRSLFLSMDAKNKSVFRKLFIKEFTYAERKTLLEKNIRVYFRWVSLYIPFLYETVQGLKTRIKAIIKQL